MEVVVRGAVGRGVPSYARRRIGELITHIDEPVPFVRVTLALAPDPARARPSMAEATIDIDGDLVRAHVAAVTMREAIDLLQARLRDRIEHRAAHRRSRQRGRGVPEAGEWHRGDLLVHRPEHFERPSEERELVARKTYAIGEATPDEAAFDMSQLGFDFYLFRDLASGHDALLERLVDGTFQLTSLGPLDVERGPTAIPLTVAPVPPPTATVSDALGRLDDTDAPFVFFADADTGRGAVVYRRYDGHYGIITPS